MAKGTSNSIALPKEKPTIRLDENDCPGMKGWKVDQEVTLTIKAKVNGLSRHEYDPDKRLWSTLEIQSVKSDDGDNIAKGMDSVKVSKVAKR